MHTVYERIKKLFIPMYWNKKKLLNFRVNMKITDINKMAITNMNNFIQECMNCSCVNDNNIGNNNNN